VSPAPPTVDWGAMRQAPPRTSPTALATFEAVLAQAPGTLGGLAALEPLLARLEAEALVEDALALFKRTLPGPERRKPLWQSLGAQLAALAQRSRDRRMSTWQRDPRRCTLRLAFRTLEPLLPSLVPGLLAQAFQDAGMAVALGLEKSPRPLVHVAHPLPPGMTGLREWADVVLRQAPTLALPALPDALAPHLPAGCAILEARIVPNHGSPVQELAREARWDWPCPPDLAAGARGRLEAFLAAGTWTIDKAGKVDGHKVQKRLEVRHLVTGLAWEGTLLQMRTRIGPGEALNPQKLLAGLLECDPALVQGLRRREVVLGEDPRLARPEVFEPKLHNMYEDAVLLESAPAPYLLDEDDDEPLTLNP
jgi:hypothetical protein